MNSTAEGTPFPTDNDFFKVLFDSLPMPVLMLDQDGAIHAVNSYTRHLFALETEGPYSDLSKVFHCIGVTVQPLPEKFFSPMHFLLDSEFFITYI